jgi:hypothetical protein
MRSNTKRSNATTKKANEARIARLNARLEALHLPHDGGCECFA